MRSERSASPRISTNRFQNVANHAKSMSFGFNHEQSLARGCIGHAMAIMVVKPAFGILYRSQRLAQH
jgi:hypothetical protein